MRPLIDIDTLTEALIEQMPVVNENMFRAAGEKLGLLKPPPAPEPVKPPEPTEEELFKHHYPASEYKYEYEDPATGKWKVWHTTMWEPTLAPKDIDWSKQGFFGTKPGEGYSFPKQWGLDKFSMALSGAFPEKKGSIKWRTIWKDKVLYSGVA